MTDDIDRVLTLTRVFQAPRARVFEAWTRSDLVAAWWGPQGYVTEHCEMDIRPGGSYRVSMRSPDGVIYWKRGVYQRIVAPERIVFTFAWEGSNGQLGHETLVTVTLEDIGGATRLTLQQAEFDTVQWRDSHRGGWTSCLERFASWLTPVSGQTA
jgi:uncharacterized protein YndB with AHSA1/START domain